MAEETTAGGGLNTLLGTLGTASGAAGKRRSLSVGHKRIEIMFFETVDWFYSVHPAILSKFLKDGDLG